MPKCETCGTIFSLKDRSNSAKTCSEECALLLKRKRNRILYHRKGKEHHRQNQRRWRKRLRKKIISILGDKCSICGRTPKRIIFHEVHFKPHNSSYYYILKHIEDFKTLCNFCHVTLHWYKNHKKEIDSIC